jgi:WD40 repeat protein
VPVPAGTWGRFSRDGTSFIYGDRRGQVWIFDAHTWKARGGPLSAHAGSLLTADLSPDGHVLATTSVDGTARLWDVSSRQPIGADLPDAPGRLVGTTFTPQGQALAVVHERGGYISDVRPSSWAGHACAVAGRTLTHAEWHNALPDRTYGPACSPP